MTAMLTEVEDVPAEVMMILSALEAGGHAGRERRSARRLPLRVRGVMRLLADPASIPGRVIYTRDVNRRSLGFVTRHRLPLGYGGLLELPTPDGGTESIHCTLLRCREAAGEWFEGSVYFNREQPQYDRIA